MGIESHLKTMAENGDLDDRRLERYRQRVSNLVREHLEDSFWTAEKKKILCESTQTLDHISTAPHTMAQELLGSQINES